MMCGTSLRATPLFAIMSQALTMREQNFGVCLQPDLAAGLLIEDTPNYRSA
jgi:hypothetical protein